jgi:hypothetical protein
VEFFLNLFTVRNYKVGDLSPKGRNGCFCYSVVHGWFFISARQQRQVGYRRIVYCLLFKTFRRNVDYLWSSIGKQIDEDSTDRLQFFKNILSVSSVFSVVNKKT